MNVIYRGGYNKNDEGSTKNSFFYEYADIVRTLTAKGIQVACVTLAKDDGHYDARIKENFGNIDTINHQTTVVNWSKYRLIFLCGGTTLRLRDGLLKLGFNIDTLGKSVVVLGDSAGAYLMSAYFFDTSDRENLQFFEGAHPQSNVITIAHVNNSHYSNEKLIKSVKDFAKEKHLRVLSLNENEEKLLNNNGVFVDFKVQGLFS